MSSNGNKIFFTAICSVGERRQIVQFRALTPSEAVEMWLSSMRSQKHCILSPEVLNELEQDFNDQIIEPVARDFVISVWNYSDVIKKSLIDVVLVATSEVGSVRNVE